jgi:transcriptional regulator with XRE-family HTH domain
MQGFLHSEESGTMPEGMTGSTVPRRQLGRYLRDLRNNAGMTVRGAAKALEWSDPKIWRIETGRTSLRALDVEQMCKIYGCTDPEMIAALMGLARETKARGWWHSYGDVIPENFDLYIGLEEAASQAQWYEPEVVPGLCQTEGYARYIIQANNPGLEPDTVGRRVQLRNNRQRILGRSVNAPDVRFVLNEGILRRLIGGPDIMGAQLDHLIELAELPTVELKIMPFAAGWHPGVVTGGFVGLRFPTAPDGTDTEPPTVYVESYTGALYLEKQSEIDRYDQAFAGIWAMALDERASIDLIKQAATELRKYEGH